MQEEVPGGVRPIGRFGVEWKGPKTVSGRKSIGAGFGGLLGADSADRIWIAEIGRGAAEGMS